MASKVEIANQAAVRIGTETRITSLDDDKVLARALNAVWDLQRQAVLRDGAWNFATRRAELAEINDADKIMWPWQHGYALPAQSLRLIEVLGYEARDDYELEGGIILTNVSGPLRVRYIVDVPETSEWDAVFTAAFALRLAYAVGNRVAGSSFDQVQCYNEYRMEISKARRSDARENPTIEQEDSHWIAARYTRGAYRHGSRGGHNFPRRY